MGPRLRKVFSDVLVVFTGARLIAIVLLSVAGICILASILDAEVSLSGGELVMLSTTTGEVAAAPLPVDNPGEKALAVDSDQWDTVRMRVTAYCLCRKCCGKYADGVTACNHKIKQGDVFVAADKKYRFGTEVIVPGYNGEKPVKVLDRGRVIKGDRLDVFYNSHRTAKKWGVKYLDVKVKKRG